MTSSADPTAVSRPFANRFAQHRRRVMRMDMAMGDRQRRVSAGAAFLRGRPDEGSVLIVRSALLRSAVALSLTVAGLYAAPLSAQPVAEPAPAATGPATVDVDLRDAPRGVFHTALTIPVRPGPLTLVYPQWIPGDHLPSGPIENLAGLRIAANGRPLAWRRDPLDIYAFRLVVPAGVSRIDVRFDYLTQPVLARMVNDVGASATSRLAVLRWHTMILYPQGVAPTAYPVRASVRLAEGWTMATAPTPLAATAAGIPFAATTLDRLIDSPLIAGLHLASYALPPLAAAPVAISLVGDDAQSVMLSPRQTALIAALLVQERALFGSVPFERYRFLVTLSDTLRQYAMGGQEHHESSDNVGVANTFQDPDNTANWATLLAHELAHVWNGKYRRPIGEATRDFQQPYDNSLLWVYEGLTSYLGEVIAARAGATPPAAFRERMARTAAQMEHQSGRRWRSLLDTGTGLGALMHANPDGANWRRSVDYYAEGMLLWMEIDLKIRELTGDRRALDDVCAAFFAMDRHRDPLVKPYDRDALVAALRSVAPYDWRTYLAERVDGVDTHLPTEVFRASGWTLAYDASPTGRTDATAYSLGIGVAGDGRIGSVERGGPGDAAGLAVGMKIVSVDGATFDRGALTRGIAARRPIALIVANDRTVFATTIRYDGGPRSPVLTRTAGPDRIAAIVAPRPAMAEPGR